MKFLIASAFAVAMLVGVGGTTIATTTPANAAVTVVVGGKLNGGIVVSRARTCRHWGHRHGRRHCHRWGYRHRVKHCNRWHYRHGRRGACRGWRYAVVWR
jgi:hypothetical protein